MASVARHCLAIGFAAAVSAALPAVVAAQVVAPRDRPPVQASGTGAIKGRVVDGVSGAAITRARVQLTGSGRVRPPTLTDGAGGFAFTELPRGTFNLMVEKPTYMPGFYPNRGRTLRSSMKALALDDGESIGNLTIPLFRGGAISGRVIDASGDPVEYADVRLLRASPGDGRPVMRGGSNTNDLGEFRFPRTEPGAYIVMVRPRRTGGDDRALNAPATPQPIPTYYPGAAALDQAQPIKVARGQSISDVDVVLAEGIPAIVSGVVVGEDGEPVGPAGYIMARSAMRDVQMPVEVAGTGLRPDGTFRLSLAPGDYVLEARSSPHVIVDRSGGMSVAGGTAGPPQERSGFAGVSVAGNLVGVTIVVGAGATATGRIVFEGASPLPPVSPAGQFQVQLFSSDGPGCRQGRTSVEADWTFRVEGLNGTCAAAPHSEFGPWVLKSVTVDGQDLRNETITFENGQRLGNVQVVLTDRRSEVSFTVADEHGQPTREFVVLLFAAFKGAPQPSSLRTFVPVPAEIMSMSRSRPLGAPGPAPAGGRDALSGLGPGEYYVIALDDIGIEDAHDAGTLARLASSAQRVTVGETPSMAVSLRRQTLEDVLSRR